MGAPGLGGRSRRPGPGAGAGQEGGPAGSQGGGRAGLRAQGRGAGAEGPGGQRPLLWAVPGRPSIQPGVWPPSAASGWPPAARSLEPRTCPGGGRGREETEGVDRDMAGQRGGVLAPCSAQGVGDQGPPSIPVIPVLSGVSRPLTSVGVTRAMEGLPGQPLQGPCDPHWSPRHAVCSDPPAPPPSLSLKGKGPRRSGVCLTCQTPAGEAEGTLGPDSSCRDPDRERMNEARAMAPG